MKRCVRMFDGCMVDGDYYENTEIMSKIETYINDKWKNLNISVATKPHETTIPEIPDDYEIPTTVVNSGPLFPTFEEVCKQFEKSHAKIINKSVFIHELDDEVMFMKADNIRISYSHLFYTKTANSSIISYILSKCFLFPISSSLLLIIIFRLSLLCVFDAPFSLFVVTNHR